MFIPACSAAHLCSDISCFICPDVQARGLAHKAHWRGPQGAFFQRFGAVKASPLAAFKLLRDGHAVLLFPGGAAEVPAPQYHAHASTNWQPVMRCAPAACLSWHAILVVLDQRTAGNAPSTCMGCRAVVVVTRRALLQVLEPASCILRG